MPMNEAVAVKKEAETLLKSIQTLSARIRKRQHHLCQYDGAKLKQKKGDIRDLQKLKTEKTQKLKKLNDRIPTMWDA